MNLENNRSTEVLVTGGTGYIGSHAVVALVEAGYAPVVVDNLSNSKAAVLERVAAITGRTVPFYCIDLRDRSALDGVFEAHAIAAVIHFAGLKAVGESVAEPLRYYENNIEETLALCAVMAAQGVRQLIFSSSATVYGEPATAPIREDFPLAPTNPYGRTKRMIEEILQDLHAADPAWRLFCLSGLSGLFCLFCLFCLSGPSGVCGPGETGLGCEVWGVGFGVQGKFLWFLHTFYV